MHCEKRNSLIQTSENWNTGINAMYSAKYSYINTNLISATGTHTCVSPVSYLKHPTTLNKLKKQTSKSQLTMPHVDEKTISSFEPLMKVIDKIATGQRVPPQVTMQYEMLRYCTLRAYPQENKPFITRLAQAGFYYANSGDELVCYCCARRKSNWTEDDVPMDVHRQMNPNCRFLTQNSHVNVPIMSSTTTSGEISKFTAEQQSFPNASAEAVTVKLVKTATPPDSTSLKSEQNPECRMRENKPAVTAVQKNKGKSLYLEKKKLQDENEKLKQQTICMKCNQKDVCIVFLPCGHLVTCESCATSERYCTVQTCEKYIKGTVRTYMA